MTSEKSQAAHEGADDGSLDEVAIYDRRRSVAAEKYDPSEDSDSLEKVVHPKTDEQRQKLRDLVKDIFILRSLDADQMQEVLDAMFEKKCLPNDHIIEQGDDGDNFYAVESGTFNVYATHGDERRLVGRYENGGSFGELALMYNMPRSATVVAVTAGSLWALGRFTFRRIVLRSAYNKRKTYEQLLTTVPVLATLTDFERMNIADALISKTYTDGQCIITQGDVADGMYFVEEGSVSVSVAKSKGSANEVARLSKGDYFGEMALVNNQPRSATICAVGDVKVAFLDKAAFERLLGPCVDLMKRNFPLYEQHLCELMEKGSSIG